MLKKIKVLLKKNQKKQCIFLFIGSVIASFFELVGIGSIPIFTMIIVDINLLKSKIPSFVDLSLINHFSHNQIAFIGAVALTVIFLSKNLYLTLMVYFQGKVTKSLRSSFGLRLFKSYINAQYIFHLQRNPAELLRGVTADISNTTDLLVSIIVLLREMLLLILIFILLFYADPFISFSVFIFLASFVGVFFFLTKKKLKIIGKMIQYFTGHHIKIVNQSFGAIKEVKMLSKEKYAEDIFKENIGNIEKNLFFNYFLGSMPKLFLEVASVLVVVVVSTIYVFLYSSITSMIPLITLLAVSAVRLIPAFGAIAISLTTIRAKIPALNFVIKEISELEKTNEILNKENKEQIKFIKNINVKKVSFRYPNTDIRSIVDFNLLINSGKKIGFIGSSGAGKSTFINLLLGLLEPTEGEILVDGKNILKDLKNWQKQIGYVSQDIYLLDDTIKNNIAFGNLGIDINSRQVLESIRTAQLESFIKSLPEGEDTIIGDRGVRLSGGQKQRIGIARALYNNPKVLVFDEATSALDLENERKIMDAICKNNKDLTFIIISHRNNTVKNCDLIYVLENGKLIDQGSYEEISERHSHLKE